MCYFLNFNTRHDIIKHITTILQIIVKTLKSEEVFVLLSPAVSFVGTELCIIVSWRLREVLAV